LLLECYRKHKQGEIAALEDCSEAAQAERYAAAY
jgi:hypothetical protein